MSTSVSVRPAVLADLRGIMRVERESWGDGVGGEAMASTDTVRHRIKLCNGSSPGWFWVAEFRGKIVGDFVLQPTGLPPEECVSWAMATDNGQLDGTFDPEGAWVYGVSLAVLATAPPGTGDLLVHAIHALRLAAGKEVLYACARMSGFRRAHARAGVSPEDYWALKRGDGTPRDPFLHHFETMIGLRPVRLLKDGYPPDRESGGHGVLCASADPFKDVIASARRILGINVVFSRKGAGQ